MRFSHPRSGRGPKPWGYEPHQRLVLLPCVDWSRRAVLPRVVPGMDRSPALRTARRWCSARVLTPAKLPVPCTSPRWMEPGSGRRTGSIARTRSAFFHLNFSGAMERAAELASASPAWKAGAQLLYQTRGMVPGAGVAPAVSPIPKERSPSRTFPADGARPRSRTGRNRSTRAVPSREGLTGEMERARGLAPR